MEVAIYIIRVISKWRKRQHVNIHVKHLTYPDCLGILASESAARKQRMLGKGRSEGKPPGTFFLTFAILNCVFCPLKKKRKKQLTFKVTVWERGSEEPGY